MDLNLSEQTHRKNSTTKITITKGEMENMDPDEVFEWDVETLDAALKELNVKGGSGWKKSKKVYEVTKAISDLQTNEAEVSKCSDPNVVLVNALQMMQKQMEKSEERMAAQMQAIAEKVGGTPNGDNVGAVRGGTHSRAKGKHPEKLDRDVDYATFLQWEKSWNLYVVSDQLDTLTDKQKTAIFLVCSPKNYSAICSADSK